MKFKRLTPLLWTENLQETLTFYTEILGFVCSEYNQEWQWAALHQNDVELMIAKPNEHTAYEKIGFTGSFYFEVDDVDFLWEQLKNQVEIVYELETFDWGMKEFAIKDTNGYILQFGQNISDDEG